MTPEMVALFAALIKIAVGAGIDVYDMITNAGLLPEETDELVKIVLAAQQQPPKPEDL